MEISINTHENKFMVLEINGEVDAYTAQDLDKTLQDLLSKGNPQIVLNVSKLTYISSAGIRTILYAHQEAVQLGGEVKLMGPTDQVRRTFEIAGIFDIIQIIDTL